MLNVYYLSQLNTKNAAEMYFQQYPERRQPYPSIFSKLDRRLREDGTFQKKRNKYESKLNQQDRQRVLNEVQKLFSIKYNILNKTNNCFR